MLTAGEKLHDLSDSLNMKIVMPTAPTESLTYANGQKLTSWFDMKTIPLMQKDDVASEKVVWSKMNQDDINSSADYMLKLARKEAGFLGNDMSKIFIGGHSQGCIISLAAFLKYQGQSNLGGVLGLSGV